MNLRRAVLITLFVLLPGTARTQMEHVPANHPVYDFLDRMHVKQIVTGYSRTILPLERRAITSFLRQIDTRIDELEEGEKSLLLRYRNEFIEEEEGNQRAAVLFRDGTKGILSDDEKYLYTWASEDHNSRLYIEALGSIEYRFFVNKKKSSNVFMGRVGGRIRGTFGGVLGYGMQATNGTLSGDTSYARKDPFLKQAVNFADWGNAFFDLSEGHLSHGWSWGALSLSRERIMVGNSPWSKTIISDRARVFDAFRFDVFTSDFRFTYIHGFLMGEKELVENARPHYPGKYLVYHRAEMDLFQFLRVGLFESVIYSQRSLDPAYLLPVNFFKSVEHATGDRDNPMLGIEMQSLCLKGTEFYGSWLIDDIDFGKIGNGWWGNKFIWQIGVLNDDLFTDTRIGMEYTRIEPYVYSHIFRNNDYTMNGVALGLDLPPNSDRIRCSISWKPSTKFESTVCLSMDRHGANEYDSTGNLIRNHGGDVTVKFDFERDNQTARFLEGPKEYKYVVEAGFRYEPIKDIVMSFTYRFTKDIKKERGENEGTVFLKTEVMW
ncbi:MAG: hypothetical protein QHI48_00355 [Bacteroidota bacterium]|nr:hypothetical protein [Bacteroidota bacterium]